MKKMEPGFILNCHDRDKNPLFESHDPSMMYDEISGMYYSYATDAAIRSAYRQGIPIRRSKDLVHFEFAGYALADTAVMQARDNGAYPPTRGFWAPFVEYVQGEYRMYYSATKAFGSSESRIHLAVSAKPEGPFENRGVVADTWGTDDTLPNAIDPHIIDDEKGNKYLVYGSFFGGIYIKELNPETGLPMDADIRQLGKRLAHRPDNSHVDGPEGAAIIRNRENGNYYLFLSYGWLGDDYDIRVGISSVVCGPYRDMEGRSLDGESLGVKLAGSYFFTGRKPYALQGEKWTFGGFRAPGHGVPFYRETESAYYFIHHVRDGAPEHLTAPKRRGDKPSYRMHYMVVRRMYFINGWPVLSPEPYAGEPQACGTPFELDITDGIPKLPPEAVRFLQTEYDKVNPEDRPGRESVTALMQGWEWLVFDPDDNRMQRAERRGVYIKEASAVSGISYDYENSTTCITICGCTADKRMLWGKSLII